MAEIPKHRMPIDVRHIPCGVNPAFSIPKIGESLWVWARDVMASVTKGIITPDAGLERRLNERLGLPMAPDGSALIDDTVRDFVYDDWKKAEARGGVYWGSPHVPAKEAATRPPPPKVRIVKDGGDLRVHHDPELTELSIRSILGE